LASAPSRLTLPPVAGSWIPTRSTDSRIQLIHGICTLAVQFKIPGIYCTCLMTLKCLLLYLWSSPTTLLGLFFLHPTLLTGGRAKIVDGVLEIQGGVTAFFLEKCTLLPGGASAMTLGHVVLGRDEAALERTRSHERVHVSQCETWGPLF